MQLVRYDKLLQSFFLLLQTLMSVGVTLVSTGTAPILTMASTVHADQAGLVPGVTLVGLRSGRYRCFDQKGCFTRTCPFPPFMADFHFLIQ